MATEARKPPQHARVVIIGSGPAAHTAGIYAGRADLHPVLYEGYLALGIAAGGQLTTTDDVENYPGFKSIKGSELMDAMKEQSIACGTDIFSQTVASVDLSSRPFKYRLHPEWDDGLTGNIEEEVYTADSIIIATGAKARRLDLPGEETYWNHGVSACAICDGSLPMFRNKHLIVIGGGDSAVEESMYLTKKASKVTVLARKPEGGLRASKANVTRLIQAQKEGKIDIRYETVATKVVGEETKGGLMTGVVIENVKTGAQETLPAAGLFYAVGHEPATALFKGQLDMDEDGYLISNLGNARTNVAGVYAAGDVADKHYRQAITSAGTGCIAALEAEKFLVEEASAPEVPEADKDVKKGDPKANGDVPAYKENPLLTEGHREGKM